MKRKPVSSDYELRNRTFKTTFCLKLRDQIIHLKKRIQRVYPLAWNSTLSREPERDGGLRNRLPELAPFTWSVAPTGSLSLVTPEALSCRRIGSRRPQHLPISLLGPPSFQGLLDGKKRGHRLPALQLTANPPSCLSPGSRQHSSTRLPGPRGTLGNVVSAGSIRRCQGRGFAAAGAAEQGFIQPAPGFSCSSSPATLLAPFPKTNPLLPTHILKKVTNSIFFKFILIIGAT